MGSFLLHPICLSSGADYTEPQSTIGGTLPELHFFKLSASSAKRCPISGLGTPHAVRFHGRPELFTDLHLSIHRTSTSSNLDTTDKMASPQALNKIAPNSPSRAKPSEIEQNIATALYELETNIPDMKSALRPLQFVSAREVR